MASAKQIKELLKSHYDADHERFKSVALQVAANEARKGHTNVAEELRALIDKAEKERSAQLGTGEEPTPIARPQGELADLLRAEYPESKLNDLILNQALLEKIKQSLDELGQLSNIRSHGLEPKRKLLLVGPPGTGKTMTGQVMANELGLPLLTVRLDGLMSKFMGETVSKLRLVFDKAEQTRGVYLFDEFDSFASERDYDTDVGEIRRVLNAFLSFIEDDKSSSIILAASNHGQRLDYALFRRFDDVLKYQMPTVDQIRELLGRRIGRYLVENGPYDVDDLAKKAEGLNFAEIEKICEAALKRMIMAEEETVSPDLLMRLVNDRKDIVNW